MLNKLFSRNGIEDVPPESNPDSIGNLAIEKGYITTDDLAEALKVQRERMQLGQILLEMYRESKGKRGLSEEQLECLLLEQRLRKGEKISHDDLRRHERKKLHRRIGAVTGTFKNMGAEARNLASAVTETMKLEVEKG